MAGRSINENNEKRKLLILGMTEKGCEGER